MFPLKYLIIVPVITMKSSVRNPLFGLAEHSEPLPVILALGFRCNSAKEGMLGLSVYLISGKRLVIKGKV